MLCNIPDMICLYHLHAHVYYVLPNPCLCVLLPDILENSIYTSITYGLCSVLLYSIFFVIPRPLNPRVRIRQKHVLTTPGVWRPCAMLCGENYAPSECCVLEQAQVFAWQAHMCHNVNALHVSVQSTVFSLSKYNYVLFVLGVLSSSLNNTYASSYSDGTVNSPTLVTAAEIFVSLHWGTKLISHAGCWWLCQLLL